MRSQFGFAQAAAMVWALAFLINTATSAHSASAAETSATPANPTNEQVLQRWTPGGDSNAADLPYRHRYADYEFEGDTHWIDWRWQQTDWGPFVTHATLVANQPLLPKNIVLFLNAEKSIAAMFDLKQCGVRTIARAAKFEIDPARFGLLRKPKLLGDFQINVVNDSLWSEANAEGTNPQPAAVSYRGLRLHALQVLLEYDVAEIPIAETMGIETASPAGTIVRQIEVSPSDRALLYQLTQGLPEQKVVRESEREQVIQQGDFVSIVGLVDAPERVKLTSGKDGAYLQIGPQKNAATVTCLIWKGSANDQAAFETWAKAFKPTSNIESLRRPAGLRWGTPLVAPKAISDAPDQSYVVDEFSPPRENPYRALFYCSGFDFFPEGTAAVCTAHGDVWLVRGLHDSEKTVTWQRFATGLFQPLGLKVVDGKIVVLGNDQMTRLHDLNGDGEADWYESLNHDLKTFGQDHAYAMRLETDAEGRFYFLKAGAPPHGSALYRLSKDAKKLEQIATGFRHPFGMGVGPAGQVTVADSEGNWVPSSKIDLITPGGFYGYRDSDKPPIDESRPLRPLCYIPKVVDNSCGGQTWYTGDRWGDFHRGGMIHFSWGRCTMHAVLEQKVKDVNQAATVEFPQLKFTAGPADAAYSPVDGQLYVVGLDGWQCAATRDGCLSRVRYTGQPTRMPSAFEVHENGILIRFTCPLEAASAVKRENFRVSQWNYRWTRVYGSYHYSVANRDVVGHDGVAVDRVSLLPDGKSVFLHIRDLKPVDQIQVHTDLFTKEGHSLVHDIYGTITALAEPLQVDDDRPDAVFAKENLVAWCIVPFDAKHRDPQQRVEMLDRLGIRRVAYDWRDENIAEFDQELSLYKQHGIELVGFWMQISTTDPLKEPNVRCVLDALERNHMHTQLWVMLNDGLFREVPDNKRAELTAKALRPVAEKAQQIGCCVGLYNHGGWFGEPDHQIQIIKQLEREAIWNVGLIYNFHHGDRDATAFPALLARMQPYLYALNLNGMKSGGPLILPIGQEEDDQKYILAIKASGYRGPIGILNHRENVDAETGLQENIRGLERLLIPPAAK